jgi:hypothetical protein
MSDETQNGSKEIRVEKVSQDEINRNIKAKNLDFGFTLFNPDGEREIATNKPDSNGSGNSGVKSAVVTYGDGAVTNLKKCLTPIEDAVSLPAKDLNEQTKEKIRNKANNSHEKDVQEK